MPHFNAPNERLFGPLPRRDILAICAFLNRSRPVHLVDECSVAKESMLNRLAAAARMQ